MIGKQHLVLAIGIGIGLLAFSFAPGIHAQSNRADPSKENSKQIRAINSNIDRLRSMIDSIEKENRQLSKRLADAEQKLADIAKKTSAQSSSGATKVKPSKSAALKGPVEDAFANWALFKSKVLAVVNPELDPMRSQLAGLGKHVHEYITGPSLGFVKLSGLTNCNDCLVAYVSAPKVGSGPKEPRLTSGPK